MHYTNLRLYLVLLFIVLGIVLHVLQSISSAWPLYVAAFILMITHFIFGTVWAAFSELKKGNIDKADHLFDKIKRPDFLTKQHRAYYHFGKGMIALQRKQLPEGDKHLKEALSIGLRTDKDMALANLNLAHINFLQKKPTEATNFLQKAKTFKTNDLFLKQNIEEMEKALGNAKK